MGLEPIIAPPRPRVTEDMTAEANRESAITVVQGKGQVMFRPTTIYIPPDVAVHLEVVDIVVGKNSQLVSKDPLPASFFSEPKSTSVWLKTDTYQIGMDLKVCVRNLSTHPIRCSFVVIGTPID